MISVIVPTFRPQQYLNECLQSLNAQTLDKDQYEVLVVLNGEKEPYYSEIQQLLCGYSFNSYLLYSDVAGVSNARNIGLDNARGDYICFIDDDDFVSPAYLSGLFAKVSPDTISLCYPYAFVDGQTGQIPYPITEVYDKHAVSGRQAFSSKVRRYFNGPWMKLIPMRVIRGRRFDPRFKNGEDALFMFLISDKIEYVDFTSKKAIYYRRYRKNSAVTSKKTIYQILENSMRLAGAYCAIFLKHPIHYRCFFFVNRLLATFKSLFLSSNQIKQNKIS